jgi:hypothetical protein
VPSVSILLVVRQSSLPARLYHRMERASMQRVKVYQLNASGTWDDKGTGHVSVERNRRRDGPLDAEEPAVVNQLEARNEEWGTPGDAIEQFQVSLKVTSEEVPTQLLLHHDVSADITYQLQGGRLGSLSPLDMHTHFFFHVLFIE